MWRSTSRWWWVVVVCLSAGDRGGRGRRHRARATARLSPVARDVVRRPRFTSKSLLVDLHARQLGELGSDPDERREPLRAEVRLLGEEAVEGRGVEARHRRAARVRPSPGRHGVVGHRVDGQGANVGMAADDALDRRGGEVLAVDAQPLVRPSGEVQPTVGVPVGEVTGPVPPSWKRARWPPRCCSSPRSPTSAAVSTISPTASSRFRAGRRPRTSPAGTPRRCRRPRTFTVVGRTRARPRASTDPGG